ERQCGPGWMVGPSKIPEADCSGRRLWNENLAAFVAGVVAVTLPEQTDGFPGDLRGVTFLVLGGLAGGVLAVGVSRVVPWILRPLSTVDQSGSVPATPPQAMPPQSGPARQSKPGRASCR